MDPEATLAGLLAAEAEGRADDAAEYAGYLAEWLQRGGFPPAGTSYAAALRRHGYLYLAGEL